jgi:hypothetical protein
VQTGDPVEIVATLSEGAWRSVTDHLQVVRCLEDGAVVSRPTVDEHGNVVCMMQRYGAGQLVEITVVILTGASKSRLVVTSCRMDEEES